MGFRGRVASGLAAIAIVAALPKGDFTIPPSEISFFKYDGPSFETAEFYLSKAYNSFTSQRYEDAKGYAEQALSYLRPEQLSSHRDAALRVLDIYRLASLEAGDDFAFLSAERRIGELEDLVAGLK